MFAVYPLPPKKDWPKQTIISLRLTPPLTQHIVRHGSPEDVPGELTSGPLSVNTGRSLKHLESGHIHTRGYHFDMLGGKKWKKRIKYQMDDF